MLVCSLMTYLYQVSVAFASASVKTSRTMKALSADEIALRIVGGEITSIRNYPFAVSIQKRYHSHYCGGTYVAPRFVLSAAHCMVKPSFSKKWKPENPRRLYVIAGATYVYFPSGSTVQMELIDMVLPHQGFKFSNMHHDIGLFRLSKPFRINTYVQYARLPSNYDPDLSKRHSTDDLCTAVGWGRHIPGSNAGTGTYLRHVHVPLIPVERCPMRALFQDGQLCAGFKEGGRDACQGDSGSPLLCNGVQVGIISFGEGCAVASKPGVYSRVDNYLEWINTTVIRNVATTYTLNHSILHTPVLYYYAITVFTFIEI